MADSIDSLRAKVASLEIRLKQLLEKEQQLELVLKSTGVGIWDWYVQTGEAVFNERWANIIGYTLEELQPTNIETWTKYAHPDDLKESARLLKAHWAGESDYYLFESRMRHRNGHWVWVYDTGRVIEWEKEGVPRRMIGTHLDITDQKRIIAELDAANRELKELGYIDPLTLIPNRRSYDERIKESVSIARRDHRPLSVLMIDIDHFKKYNDDFGHQKGDEALALVAKTIQHAMHRETDFVARYGGEEFVVILHNTALDGAKEVANHILEAVIHAHIPHPQSAHHGLLTVSVGVASATQDYANLLMFADKALYRAKSLGRNRYEIYNLDNANRS